MRRIHVTSPLRRIACCVDGGDASMRALADGARLGGLSGASVIAVSAVADPDDRDWEPLAERWRSIGARPVVIPDHGQAASAVCEWAEREGCDLLIAAPHRGPVRRLLLGSFADHLLGHPPCWVMVARPVEHQAEADPAPPDGWDPWATPLQQLVEPLEPLRGGDPVSRAVQRLAETHGSSVPVLDGAGALVGVLGWSEILAAMVPAGARGPSSTGALAPDQAAIRRRTRSILAGSVFEYARTVDPARLEDTPARVMESMLRQDLDSLPVLGQWERLAGVVRAGTLLLEFDAERSGAGEASDEGDRRPAAGPYRHIGCCVESSPASLSVLRAGTALRGLGHGALTVVHAVRGATDPASAAGRRLVADAAREVDAGGDLVYGDPPVAIAAWAREHGVDLLVVAPHREGLERVFEGSFTRRLARVSPCSALVTRARGPDGRPDL